MLSADLRNQCFTDFRDRGISLRQISEERGVRLRTLERWSSKFGWVEQRRLHWNAIQSEILGKAAKGMVRADILMAEATYDIFSRAHAQFMAYMEGKIPKKAVKLSLKQMITLAKAHLHASKADRYGPFGSGLGDIFDEKSET